MPANLPPDTPDIGIILRLLRKTRYLLRSSWVATGLFQTIGIGVGVLVILALVDLIVPLPPGFRLACLLLVTVPAAVAFLIGVAVPALRPLGSTQVARTIEAKIPGIHNRLVSCLDLMKQGDNGRPSAAFYRRLVGEAIDRVRSFRARRVVNFARLRRAGTLAGLASVAFVLAALLFSDRLPTAMARIFSPLADIPPASSVAYSVTPKDTKILRGEDLTFAANVDKGTPEILRLELFSESAGKTYWYDLQKKDQNQWKLNLNLAGLEGYQESFTYRVHGGGTWSKQYRVTLVERPTITAFSTILHYPPYMKMPEPRVGPPQVAEVTGPEGSQVELVLDTEGNVAKGEIQFLVSRQKRVKAADRPERVWFEDGLPAGAVTEEPWKWDKTTHKRSAHVGTFWHRFQGASKGFPVNPGEHLSTYVYIVPNQGTEALMLAWHDGGSWDHRAYWGKEVNFIKLQGKRKYMGPLPPQGQWVRLEVPAELLELQGKSLHGMSFFISGGQCYWSRAGCLPPTHTTESELVPVASFPMQKATDNRWTGRFPLKGIGLYRAELRNDLGHANKPMKEAKYIAIADTPPQIVLDRPGTDLVLSQPGKIPLVVTAYDDFGLDAIELHYRRGESYSVEKMPIKQYPQPVRSDTVITNLDLAAMKMKVGDHLHYRLSARDTKGQVAQTQEFQIRISADKDTADQRLANFEKTQDPFQDKLVKLIADQAKVRVVLEKLSGQYATLMDKIDAAKLKTGTVKEAAPGKPPPPPEMPKLDAESVKMLQGLQGALKELAKQEEQNVQLGKQVSDDLVKAAAEAAKLDLLPQQVGAQMKELQEQFQRLAMQPLQNLAARLNQGADPKQGAPDLNDLKKLGDRLQRDLEAMKARVQALAEVRKLAPDDVAAALKKLQEQLQQQADDAKSQNLQDLQDFLAKLRNELKRLQASQGELIKQTKMSADDKLKELEAKQKLLDQDAEKPLAQVKKLSEPEKTKRMKRKPSFPDQPYDPETGEQLVRPKEEDPDEPAIAKKEKTKGSTTGADGKKEKEKDKKESAEEDEPKFFPALGGPKPKLDPRFAKKVRPIKKKPKEGTPADPQDRRDELEAKQAEQMQDLDAAEQSLAADQNTLEQLMQQLQKGMQAKGEKGQAASEALKQALAMAQRMQQLGQPGQGGQPQQAKGADPKQPSQGPTQGNLHGGTGPGSLDAELAKLDPSTRNVMLRLPPQIREQLLQGMREDGPEGYRQLIQDYFRRLAETK